MWVYEVLWRIDWKGNLVVRWDNNWLGLNELCEDCWVMDFVCRDGVVGGVVGKVVNFWMRWYRGDLILFELVVVEEDEVV